MLFCNSLTGEHDEYAQFRSAREIMKIVKYEAKQEKLRRAREAKVEERDASKKEPIRPRGAKHAAFERSTTVKGKDSKASRADKLREEVATARAAEAEEPPTPG